MALTLQCSIPDVFMGFPEPCLSPVYDSTAFLDFVPGPYIENERMILPEPVVEPDETYSHATQMQSGSKSSPQDEGEQRLHCTLNGRQARPTPRRKSVPTTEWNKHRSKILMLYQALPLEQVQRIMKRDGLDADVQMYKKRLSKWQIRKYYSKEEKLAIIQQLNNGCEPVLPDGRPVDQGRLKRPVQMNGQKMKLTIRPCYTKQHPKEADTGVSSPDEEGGEWPESDRRSSIQMSPESYMDSQTPLTSHSPDLSLAWVKLEQSPETQCVERVLRCASQYWKWYFTQTIFERNMFLLANGASVFSCIRRATSSLAQQPRLAFEILDRACDGARLVFREQPFRLLTAMADVFQLERWKEHSLIRSKVLQYLVALAAQVLGKNHPIASILKSFLHPGVLQAVAPKLIMLGIDAGNKSACSDQYWLLHHKISVAEDLADLGETDRAIALLQEVAEEKEETCPNDHVLSLSVVDSLAAMAWAQSRDADAETHWLEVFQKANIYNEQDFASISAISLGELYEKREAWDQSEYYYRSGLATAAQRWPIDDSRVYKTFNRLGQILRQQGKVFEICALQEQHPELSQHLDL